MAFEDIERLKDKINKDPNSKLFIPLAEEYKKAGMFDEAIEVLTKGLERQPDYMSARVSLGKIYMERGMLEEARGEFEKVVGSIPDNLYAHKRLAEIYRDIGERDKAVKEFKTVLQINPMDDWAATNLTDIQAGPQSVPEAEKVPETEELPGEISEVIEKKPPEIEDIDGALEDIEEIPEEGGDESLEEIGEISYEIEEALEEIDELSPDTGGETAEPVEGMISEISEKTVEEILPFSEVKEEILEGEDEDMPATAEVPEEEAHPIEEVYKPSEAVFDEEKMETEVEASEERPLSVYDAEIFIAKDRFIDAMGVYRKILLQDPGNKHVLQRIEELKALLKLLGKDTGELIARLNYLQQHFEKRRNEFRRNT